MKILSSNSNPVWDSQNDLSQVTDIWVNSSFAVTLDAKDYDLTRSSNSARGFDFDISFADCGGWIDASKSVTFGFNSSNALNGSTSNRCIWFVDADHKAGSKFSDTLVNINVTLAEKIESSKVKLSVYDTISMRNGSVHIANGSVVGSSGQYRSSVRTMVIVYDYSLASKSNFSVQITAEPQSKS